MAADPLAAAVLLGLGIDRLSLSPRRVPEIKTRIRELDVGQLREHVAHCAELASAAEVEEYLAKALFREGRTRAAGGVSGADES